MGVYLLLVKRVTKVTVYVRISGITAMREVDCVLVDMGIEQITLSAIVNKLRGFSPRCELYQLTERPPLVGEVSANFC
jgi:hypothetical protein